MDRRLQQLKNAARREEQRENWARAIELYSEALRRSEEVGSVSLDVSLYNRVGDLHRRLGDAERAVSYYLKAVDRYAEQELHTGAVALCNKVLRIAPERADVHRELGRLYGVTGLVAEARKSYETYVERMEAEGRHRERRSALLELAELTDDRDLLLRVTSEMVEAGQEDEALRALLGWAEASPRDSRLTDRIRSIDPSALGPDPGEVPAGDLPPGGEAEPPEAPEAGRRHRPVQAEPGDHVEMGLALFEMGRIDDAIRELQIASRADDPPVRAFEVLGQCFIDKDLPQVAARVLNRALHLPGHAEHDLLGVLHSLGVAHQSMGRYQRALDCFQRVYAVDIDFRDVSERMEQVLPHL